MGIIGDSLNRTAAATFTRSIPASAGAQVRFLVKHEKGSTRVVAAISRVGVSGGEGQWRGLLLWVLVAGQSGVVWFHCHGVRDFAVMRCYLMGG